ncbi:MAG: hypothetical protein WCF08_03435 [Anaerolineaceae bacterium]
MAHTDLDELLNTLLPFAQQMLEKNGEFFPFGADMKPAGEIEMIGAYEGHEHPPSQTLINLMTEAFQKQALNGELRAAGICYDVRTIPPGETEKCDAICMSLEHQSGEAVDVFVPYKKAWHGKIRYGEIFASCRSPQFMNKGKNAA